jgi:medium-chain acyl-[acyl-carrier-protein] hydrolase
MPPVDNPWIVRRNVSRDATLRVFCVPYAGAGAAIFRDWHNAFPSHIEVCAIEPPGRFARQGDPVPTDMSAYADAMEAALGPFLDVPFAFFGYSLGALMAFECARRVRARRGLEPSSLIVAAHKAPQLAHRNGQLSGIPKSEFVPAIERRYGPLDPAIRSEPQVLDMVVNIMRTDLKLLEDYRYEAGQAFECPILAVGGLSDESVTQTELEGWREQTARAFRVEMLSGGHFFLRTSASALHALVRSELERCAPSPASTRPYGTSLDV